MKPLHPTEGPLAEVKTALAAGRLADLLRGHGLTQKTVEELLRPESAVTLRSILTRHLVPAPGDGIGASVVEADAPPTGLGKVLAFRARKPGGR